MVDDRPTLESQGIDKNLAQQGRVLGALSDEKFEKIITATRGKVARTIGNRRASLAFVLAKNMPR